MKLSLPYVEKLQDGHDLEVLVFVLETLLLAFLDQSVNVCFV